jgi:small ligand-binding sensory domain FIST
VFVGRVINEYKDHFGRGDFLIRNIIAADRASGFIAVSDFVRVGQTVQFHVRDRRTAEEDLRLLLQTQLLHDPAAGVLMCTCNGRGRNMFDKPNTESTIVREALGDVPIAGFFAAGEIGPIGTDNFVHGFTAALAIFRPADA